MRTACLPALAALLLLLLAGCGGGEPPREEGGRWGWWGMGPKEKVALDAPRAEHGRWGDSAPALTVNLLNSGDLLFQGREFRLATGNEDERQSALDAYAVHVSRFAEVEPPPGLRVHADRSARWEFVGAVVRATRKVLRVQPLSWSADYGEDLRDVHQAADVEALDHVTPALPVVEIRARPAGRMRREARLAVGSWSAVQEEENGHCAVDPWAADAPRLKALLGGARGIVLRTFDESVGEKTGHVAWGHVAKVLDVLLDTGARQVELPGLGIRLHLLEPQDLVTDPFPYPDDPVATPVVVLLAVLAVLAAFAATFAPLLFRRSARKRPRGTGAP